RPGRWLGGVAVSGRRAGRRGSVRGRRPVRPPRRGEPVAGAGVADGPGRWRDGTGVGPGRRPGPGRTPARRRAITPLPVTNLACARRSAPPNAIWLAMLRAPATSTAVCRSGAAYADWLALSGRWDCAKQSLGKERSEAS